MTPDWVVALATVVLAVVGVVGLWWEYSRRRRLRKAEETAARRRAQEMADALREAEETAALRKTEALREAEEVAATLRVEDWRALLEGVAGPGNPGPARDASGPSRRWWLAAAAAVVLALAVPQMLPKDESTPDRPAPTPVQGPAPESAPSPASPASVELGLGLDRAALREIQRALQVEGFSPGTPDGVLGPSTREALQRWQSENDLPATGYLTELDVSVLRAAAPLPPEPPPPPPPLVTGDLPSGTITGVVTDDSGLQGVLPGVEIELSSDALVEGSRSGSTNALGEYFIFDLSPDIYTVTFSLPGFVTQIHDQLTLDAGDLRQLSPVLVVGSGTQRVIDGTINRGDFISQTGEFMDRWSFDFNVGDRIELSAVSTDFNTLLRVIAPSGELVDEDDDGGTGLNSRIERIAAYTGEYVVEVVSWDNAMGDYTLQLTYLRP